VKPLKTVASPAYTKEAFCYQFQTFAYVATKIIFMLSQ